MSSYIIGKKAIIELIKNNVQIKVIKSLKFFPEIRNLNKKIKWEIVDKSYFKNIEGNHQGIIAYLKEEIKLYKLDDLITEANKLNSYQIVVIDSIESPHNFGAIIRNCVAFNIDAIVFKNNNQSPINDIVIKTSVGAIKYLKLCKVSNINYAVEKLKKNNFWIFGTLLNDTSQELDKISFTNKNVIIFGNEQKGISNLISKNCDEFIKIKTNEKIQSLNVSVALGIVLYELNKKLLN